MLIFFSFQRAGVGCVFSLAVCILRHSRARSKAVNNSDLKKFSTCIMENWFPSFYLCWSSFVCVCVWLVGFETASLLQVGPEFLPAQAALEVKAVILPRVWDQAWATMPGCFVVFTWEPSPLQRRAGQVTGFVPLLQCDRLSCCSPTTCALLVSTERILFAREINWRRVCDLVLQEYVFFKGSFQEETKIPFWGSKNWNYNLTYVRQAPELHPQLLFIFGDGTLPSSLPNAETAP